MGVSRDDAAIEANINPALVLSSTNLLMETSYRGSRRDSIEWHIHDGGHATKGSGLRAGIEAFPLSPAWLVQVHMGVHQSGHEHIGGIIPVRVAFGKFRGGSYGFEYLLDLAG